MNIFERGYNRWLTREAPSENLESKNAFEEGVSPNMLLSGGLSGNLEMVDGHMQSSNFEDGVAGWQIKYDGTSQFSDITLIGGQLNYQKTSFTDDTKAGYYIGSEGIYAGAVDDATKLKFTIADGTLEFIGSHSGGTIGGVNVTNIANVGTSTADAVPSNLTVSDTGITVADDGTISAYVTLTWTAITTNTFDHYLIRYKKNTYTYYTNIPVTTNTITIDGLVPNTAYNFGIASVNKYGTQSAFSSNINQTTATSTTPPATVADVSATAGIQYVIVEWTANSERDIASYNVYRHTADSSGDASVVANIKGTYFVDGGRTGGTELFYWVKAVNTSNLESDDFSTVASATPRNVTSDDIVTLAGSKVLIDGTTYLSNWRKTGDLTKIDGGSISTNTVTTTQLNFTPVQDSNVIASINASEEGIRIGADNIEISGSTTFATGYDPSDKVDEVGGTYDSAASGARVRIFPDANTGIQIIDDASNDVFKAMVGGTHVGDVIIGDYAGGQGIFYDKSENVTTFAGSLSAANGTLGSLTIDASGYISTSASGKRLVLSSNSLIAYDDSGNTTLVLDADSNAQILQIISPDSDSRLGLFLDIDGTGVPLQVQEDNADNANDAIRVISAGQGSGLSLNMTNTSASAPTISISEAGNGPTMSFGGTRISFNPSNFENAYEGDIAAYRQNLYICKSAGTPGVWIPLEKKNFTFNTTFGNISEFYTSQSGSGLVPTYSAQKGIMTMTYIDDASGSSSMYKRVGNTDILSWSKPRYCKFAVKFSSVDYHQDWAAGFGTVNSGWTYLAPGSSSGVFFVANDGLGLNKWRLSAVVNYGYDDLYSVTTIGDDYLSADTIYTFEILFYPSVSSSSGEIYFYINGSLVATHSKPSSYTLSSNDANLIMYLSSAQTDGPVSVEYPYYEFWQAI